MPEGLSDEVIGFLLEVMELAREGERARLEELLDSGVPVNLTNSVGDSLLILAAYHLHPETVQMLLARGADTERLNDRGQTALGAAVFRQSGEIVSALLAAGADPSAGGPSSIEVAEFFGLPEMSRLLTGVPDRTAGLLQS